MLRPGGRARTGISPAGPGIVRSATAPTAISRPRKTRASWRRRSRASFDGEDLGAADEPREAQGHLHLGMERLAVDPDGAAGDQAGGAIREDREAARGQRLGPLGEGAHAVVRADAATAAAKRSTSSAVVSQAHIQRTTLSASSQM